VKVEEARSKKQKRKRKRTKKGRPMASRCCRREHVPTGAPSPPPRPTPAHSTPVVPPIALHPTLTQRWEFATRSARTRGIPHPQGDTPCQPEFVL